MEIFRISDNGITNVTILFVDDNESPFKEYLIDGRWKSCISYAIIDGVRYYFKFGLSVFRQLVTWCGEGNLTNNTVAINFNVYTEGTYGRKRYFVSDICSLDESVPIRSTINFIKSNETPISEITQRLSNNNIKPRKKRITYEGKGMKHKFI
jgi:hypothetical protein